MEQTMNLSEGLAGVMEFMKMMKPLPGSLGERRGGEEGEGREWERKRRLVDKGKYADNFFFFVAKINIGYNVNGHFFS